MIIKNEKILYLFRKDATGKLPLMLPQVFGYIFLMDLTEAEFWNEFEFVQLRMSVLPLLDKEGVIMERY